MSGIHFQPQKRIVHNGLDEHVVKEPSTVLEASIPPPQYTYFSHVEHGKLPPILLGGSKAFRTPQRYPQILENPTLKECFTLGTRVSDLLEFSLYGVGFALLGLTDIHLGRKAIIGNMLSLASITSVFFPIAMWRRSYGRLTGHFENLQEQETFGLRSDRMVSKVVRKRVFNSKEDDPEFMDRWLDHVDNRTYSDMKAYWTAMNHIHEKMKLEGVTLEDFKSYPSDALSDPKAKQLYKTLVGHTPDLQKFFLEHPEAVSILRDQPWALQEYEHGNRFLAKMYRVWTQPQVHDFLQTKPVYISNFMYNKITWEDLLDFADDWKNGNL